MMNENIGCFRITDVVSKEVHCDTFRAFVTVSSRER